MKKSLLLNKIFKKKEKESNKFVYSNKEGYAEIVYQNDHTVLVHDSCRICYNKKMDKNFEERMKYIADKVKIGHDSILEHSNVIMKLSLTKELYPELCEVLTTARYLNSKIVDTNNKIEVLLGGSIRGFRHILKTIKNSNNIVFNIIKECLYELPYCYFIDMIEDNIFEKRLFNNFDIKSEVTVDNISGDIIKTKRNNGIKIKKDKYEILGIDDVIKVYNLVNNHDELFTIDDILDMVTISILFKGVSRTASHQLVRHRAGITQLSQRYVNMKDSNFLSPEEFKPEKYNSTTKYKINISDIEKELTLKEIGKLELGIYEQLLEQGLLKEDARSFLPSNIETSLYMTFTFKNFIKFLQLRTGKGAQAEIKQLALSLEKDFKNSQCKYIGEDIYSYLLPNYNIIPIKLDMMGKEVVDEIIGYEEKTLTKEELEPTIQPITSLDKIETKEI